MYTIQKTVKKCLWLGGFALSKPYYSPIAITISKYFLFLMNFIAKIIANVPKYI